MEKVAAMPAFRPPGFVRGIVSQQGSLQNLEEGESGILFERIGIDEN